MQKFNEVLYMITIRNFQKEKKEDSSSSSNPAQPLKKVPLQNEVPNTIQKYIGSFLDINSRTKFSLSSRWFHFLFKDDEELLLHRILYYVFQADLKKLENLCKLPPFDGNILLKKSSYRERGFSLRPGQNTFSREWKEISPIKAAAYSANNFLLRKLLSFLPKNNSNTIQQLQEVLDDKDYLLPYRELIRMHQTHSPIFFFTTRIRTGQYTTARVLEHGSEDRKKWLQEFSAVQERLPIYGIKKYFSKYFFQVVLNSQDEQIIENECHELNPSALFLANNLRETQYMLIVWIYMPSLNRADGLPKNITGLDTYGYHLKKTEDYFPTYSRNICDRYLWEEIPSLLNTFCDYQKKGLIDIIKNLSLNLEQSVVLSKENKPDNLEDTSIQVISSKRIRI